MSTPMTTSAATATLGSSSSRISTSLNPRLRRRSHIPHTVYLSFGCLRFPNRSLRLLPTATGQGPPDPALLRRPLVSDPSSSEGPIDSFISSEEEEEGEESDTESSGPGQGMRRRSRKSEEWVDWEDLILEETVPLASFIRMILHSGKYKSGDRLSSEHEKIILERLLPYHPEMEKKIGCGFDHITIGFHPEYENSRCLFIVQKDGESVDFSYWKCIKGLIRRKYPLYADTFILRHFKRRRYLYPLCLVHFTLGKLEQKYACIAQVFESTWAVGRQGPFRLEKGEGGYRMKVHVRTPTSHRPWPSASDGDSPVRAAKSTVDGGGGPAVPPLVHTLCRAANLVPFHFWKLRLQTTDHLIHGSPCEATNLTWQRIQVNMEDPNPLP